MSSCVRIPDNIVIYEGGTFYHQCQLQVGSPAVPVDLTGYTARMMVRAKMSDTTPLLTLNTILTAWNPDAATGIYFTTPASGIFVEYAKDEDTTGICASHKDISGFYDLFLTSPAGETLYQLSGTATIYAAVTHS